MDVGEDIQIIYRIFLDNSTAIKINLDQLYKLLDTSPLNRTKCARVLSQLRGLLNAINSQTAHFCQLNERTKIENDIKVFKDSSPGLVLLYVICMAYLRAAEKIRPSLTIYASRCYSTGKDMMKKYTDGSYMYKEQDLVEKIYEIYSDLDDQLKQLDISIKNEIIQQGYKDIRNIPIALIIDLVTFKVIDWPGLDDRWACASCYLASLEVAVNKACKKCEIKSQEQTKTDDFKKKLDGITNRMKNEGIETSKIEKDIVSRLYDYRNYVLHGGYIPNDEEFKYITEKYT